MITVMTDGWWHIQFFSSLFTKQFLWHDSDMYLISIEFVFFILLFVGDIFDSNIDSFECAKRKKIAQSFEIHNCANMRWATHEFIKYLNRANILLDQQFFIHAREPKKSEIEWSLLTEKISHRYWSHNDNFYQSMPGNCGLLFQPNMRITIFNYKSSSLNYDPRENRLIHQKNQLIHLVFSSSFFLYMWNSIVFQFELFLFAVF